MDFLITPENINIPPSAAQRAWGLHVSRVGCSGRDPGYTGQGPSGRVLDEFAVVYLTRGGGTFYAAPEAPRAVSAGDMLVLFPGVWHRYHPDPETGWNEHWVIFDGTWARGIWKRRVIAPERAILHPGMDPALHQLFNRLIEEAKRPAPGHERELAALCAHVLARALSLSASQERRARPRTALIDEAVAYLQEHRHEAVDLEKLASSLHVSYPHFRRLFRRVIGVPPHQYHLQLRIARAKELLERGDLSVKEVAARVGFDDRYYFARLFRRKAGVPPSRWTAM
jgi:AraC-like DNA-binding protein